MTMATFDFPAAPTEGQMYAPVGGPLYVYNAPVWKVAGITTIPGEWKIVETLITAPSTTYIKPANLAYLEVEGVGPGGGSGAAAATSSVQTSGSGGGGAGAWGRRLFAASELGASEAITIGANGTGGVSSTNGTAGGTSEFGTGRNCTLGGGGGSIRQVGANTAVARADGGIGGALGSGWTIGAVGEVGACTNLLWNSTLVEIGRGGQTPFGTSLPSALVSSAAGNPAVGYGSGARGAGHNISTAAQNGGDGAPGMFILKEYFPAWVLGDPTPAGAVVSSAYAEYTTNAALTAIIPPDDTIPLISEGTEILTLTFIPKSVTNKLRCRFNGQGALSVITSNNVNAAIFQGSTCIGALYETPSGINAGQQMSMEVEVAAGAVTAQTISVRVGPSVASAMRMNGTAAGRVYGGASRCTLVVEEIKG